MSIQSTEIKGSTLFSNEEESLLPKPRLSRGRGRHRSFRTLLWRAAGYSTVATIGFLALASL